MAIYLKNQHSRKIALIITVLSMFLYQLLTPINVKADDTYDTVNYSCNATRSTTAQTAYAAASCTAVDQYSPEYSLSGVASPFSITASGSSVSTFVPYWGDPDGDGASWETGAPRSSSAAAYVYYATNEDDYVTEHLIALSSGKASLTVESVLGNFPNASKIKFHFKCGSCSCSSSYPSESTGRASASAASFNLSFQVLKTPRFPSSGALGNLTLFVTKNHFLYLV